MARGGGGMARGGGPVGGPGGAAPDWLCTQKRHFRIKELHISKRNFEMVFQSTFANIMDGGVGTYGCEPPKIVY